MLVAQRILWPAPAGIVVRGAVIGGLTALVALGISLVYRANRIVNFAQGDLGAAPAALAVLLITSWGLPYFVAMSAGLVAAVGVGAAVELLVIRRFFKAPRLILTVATIGLAQIMVGVGLLMPLWFDDRTPAQQYPAPFDWRFTIRPVIFDGNYVIAMIVVPVAMVALAVFLRATNIGIAIRASAESADRASLLGVPVKRVHTIVWSVAAGLAFLALFLRAGIVGLPIGTVLGPGLLLRALAACVIGRMERLGVITLAAVALGVVEQAVQWDTGRGILIDPVLAAVILAVLLVRRRTRGSRVEASETSTWQAAREVRPVPRPLVRLPEVRWGRWAVALPLAVFVLSLPAWLSESRINLAAAIAIFAIVGVSLVVLTGWAGQVSLGQMAFVGIGAAVGGWVTSVKGWDLLVAVVLAGVAGAVASVAIGLPALRVRGLLLAVTTLAFGLAASSWLLNRQFFDWLPRGRIERRALLGRVDIASEARFYYVALAGLALALVAVRSVRRSRTGRVLIAIRENERAAQSYGVSTLRTTVSAFAISGFLAAFAGALFVHHQQAFTPTSFSPGESLKVFSMVVVGGLGSVPGAVIGAVYLRGIEWFLPSDWRFLATGAGLLFVLMLLPGGVGSALYDLRDGALRRIAARRGLLVPSLVADRRPEDPPVPTAPELVELRQ